MVIVNVEDPVPVIEVGLKVYDAPEGNVLRLRITNPSKPLTAVVDTV